MNARRTTNPRLGLYYGIVTSTFVSFVLLMGLSEQLGFQQSYLSTLMILGPIAFVAAIAFATRTLDRLDFHTAGRRVPPVFSGLTLAAVTVGGVGFFAVTGALLFIGFDGLAIVLGWTLGLLAAGVFFLPYLRKAGAYTLPAYFGQRFGSSDLRWIAALCMLPPLWLLFVAELKIAGFVTSLFLPLSFQGSAILVGLLVAATVALGGMRSVTWTGAAQFIIALIGLGVPLIVAAVMLTNLPVPQLTYGELFDRLGSYEATLARNAPAGSIAQALPGESLGAITRPFLEPFLSLTWGQFIALVLCFAMGVAALPSLLVRAGSTRTVFEQRRAAAWGILLVALIAITIPAYAAYVRFSAMQELSVAKTPTPSWVRSLQDARLAGARDADGDGQISASEITFSRDGAVLALPVINAYPFVLTLLVAIGGIAIAMAAAAAHLLAMAASLSEDVYAVIADPAASPGRRLLMARLFALAGGAMAIAWLTALDLDVLKAACWALSYTASTVFPVLLLSIWWARLTVFGALAAMLTGAVVSGSVIVAGELVGGGSLLGVESLVAGMLGAPLAFIAGIGVSFATGAPSEADRDFVEDMRHAGGDTLYDRATRRATRTA